MEQKIKKSTVKNKILMKVKKNSLVFYYCIIVV